MENPRLKTKTSYTALAITALNLLVIVALMMALGCKAQEFGVTDDSLNTIKGCEPNCNPGGGGTKHYDYAVVTPNGRSVDILFVIDNSPSMIEEQANLSQRFANFTATLNGLDWRIAVTSTDITTNGANGHLLTFENANGQSTGLKFIDAATPQADALFRATVQMGDNGSSDERGIYAANLAVDFNEDNWIRLEPHLAIVVVSDEDERSTGNNLADYDKPTRLLANVPAKLGANKGFSFHSVITRPNDFNCLAGAGANYGNVYYPLSQMTSGVVGDICSQDYTAELQQIAQNIQGQVDSVAIQCQTPINNTVTVTFTPSQNIITTVQAGKVFFSPAPAPATTIHLIYDCPTQ